MEYGLTISVQKTKSMALKGRDPIRSKIVTDNKIIEQVNSFNHLGNLISYENEMDIDTENRGIINNVFRPKNTLKKSRIKLNNTLGLPTFLYSSQNWTIIARDAQE
jgi:hypothetical protein